MLRKLFNREIASRHKKGRNPELVKLRDEALLRRFVYWNDVKRVRLDDVLSKLSLEEFFIDEKRIIQILNRNSERINAIRNGGKKNQLKLFE